MVQAIYSFQTHNMMVLLKLPIKYDKPHVVRMTLLPHHDLSLHFMEEENSNSLQVQLLYLESFYLSHARINIVISCVHVRQILICYVRQELAWLEWDLCCI